MSDNPDGQAKEEKVEKNPKDDKRKIRQDGPPIHVIFADKERLTGRETDAWFWEGFLEDESQGGIDLPGILSNVDKGDYDFLKNPGQKPDQEPDTSNPEE